MSEQGNTNEAQAAPSGKMDLTIQGIQFECAAPYAEGHVLTKAESGVLNQTRAENLRNNFAGVIRKKLEELEKETPPRKEFNTEELSNLAEQFSAYEETYEFQGKRTSRAPVDPVKREANRIARSAITAALEAKNITVKSLVDGKMEELISQYLDRNPSVMDEARDRIAAAKAAAESALGDDFNVAEAVKPEPEAPAAPAA